MIKHTGIGLIGLAILLTNIANAAPNGTPTIPGGVTQFFIADFPPIPGNYAQFTSSYSTADRAVDHNGDKSGEIDLKVKAQTLRLMTIWDKKILGADVVASEIIGTYVDLDNTIFTPYADIKLSDSGLADVLIEPLILQWNRGDRKQWKFVSGAGVVVPVGSYSKKAKANVSAHHYSFAPRFAAKYKTKSDIEIGVSPMLNFNWKNEDTGYRTGNELTIDYVLNLKRNSWRYGLTGFYYIQLENDEQNGNSIANSKSEGFAVGPAVQYQFMNGKGPLVSANWMKDVYSRNRSESDTFMMSVAVKF